MALGIGCLYATLPRAAIAEQPANPPAAQDAPATTEALPIDAQAPAPVEAAAPVADADIATPAAPARSSANDIGVVPTIALPPDTPPVPVADEPASQPQIAEVIVPATKRSENVRDIPASIAVLSGEEDRKSTRLNSSH